MKPVLSTLAVVLSVVALIGLTSLFAGPNGRTTSSDLDEPTTAYDAASRENNDPEDDRDGDDPGERNDPPPPEIFGEPVPGKKVLLVLDRTCSMSGMPIVRMQAEVTAALDALKANNEALKAQWMAEGREGPEPKIEFALVRFNAYAQYWRDTMVEANEGNVSGAKGWVNALYANGTTSWTRAFQKAQTFGGVFDTIFFLSDGFPNTAQPWDPHADVLASLYFGKEDGVRFIAQFFDTSTYYGGSTAGYFEMQRCATRFDGKPNVTGVFSSVR